MAWLHSNFSISFLQSPLFDSNNLRFSMAQGRRQCRYGWGGGGSCQCLGVHKRDHDVSCAAGDGEPLVVVGEAARVHQDPTLGTATSQSTHNPITKSSVADLKLFYRIRICPDRSLRIQICLVRSFRILIHKSFFFG